MKALAWYTIVFNILVIILFILLTAGVVAPPPLTLSENIVWIVLTVPAVVLGIMVIRRSE